MAIDSVADFTDALRRSRLLEPAQLDEVTGQLQARFPEPHALADELLRRGWLTPFQVKQIFRGKARSLLLGSYVLLERLGQGGMGQVFKARHWKLGRIVALKVIHKHRLAKPDSVQRFEREIRAAAQLDHPNIVRAFDADRVGEVRFFVMEYVAGPDLGRLVAERGPLPVAVACDYIRQAALGLQHAHEHGLVHRDIKPSNLLLSVPLTPHPSPPRGGEGSGSSSLASAAGERGWGEGGVIKVLDMGLARLDHPAEDEEDNPLTQAGAAMGTVDYIAPEQALDAHRVDIRADLYSLGCTFYFLLTGSIPFPGGTPMERLLRHREQEPVPVERLRPDVPPAVGAILRKLMAKRPEDRYQTPAEVAAALVPWCRAAGARAPVIVPLSPSRGEEGRVRGAMPAIVPETDPEAGGPTLDFVFTPRVPAPGVDGKRLAVVLAGSALAVGLLVALLWWALAAP
ncbi:MAG TPA: serine/threonine-protein kinase [Gemmataceae bacterium]|nr:serine/threonine-protein kinase [Gemmataceae bacterium]